MIKNYFKIAFRNFLKSKLTSLINIGSLSVGIACCIIIILYVKNEWTYDQFHSKADRLYRVWNHVEFPGSGLQKAVFTPFNMTRLMSDDYDEVEAYTTFGQFGQEVQYKDQKHQEAINMVSAGFFKMFDFPVLSGSVEGALGKLDDIVITKTIAEKYFGTVEAAGEQIQMNIGNEDRLFTIKAVLNDVPINSSIRFQFLVSDENAKFIYPENMLNTWNMIVGTSYVLLKEGTNQLQFEAKLPALVKKTLNDNQNRHFSIHLQPISDIHLNNEFPAGFAPVSDPKYTYILTGIAVLILILGCVNFMILSVGKASARAKEIGIRKTVGAHKKQLSAQLIAEGILLALISLLAALLLAKIALPFFNELSGNSLQMTLSPANILMFLGLTLLVGFVASIYPAFVISAFSPMVVLKGGMSQSGKHYFKMMLVTGQFILSIFLVSTTVLMQKQLHYLQNKNLGFDSEQVVTLPLQVQGARGLIERVNQGMEKSQLIKNGLANNTAIVSMAVSSLNFGDGNWMQLGYYEGDNEALKEFRVNVVDEGFIPTMQMEIVEGRNFEKGNLADKRSAIIVNESFVRAFGLENPIGDRIPNKEAIDHQIIGVVKDFHFASLHTKVEPLVLTQNLEIAASAANNFNIESDPTPKIMVRLTPGKFEQSIEVLKKEWQVAYGEETFDYSFINDGLARQYEAEQNLGKIVSAATFLALVIGCMGLFALATLTMNARVKEISIRKVLGAPINNILYLLSRSYVIIITVALLISVPMTIYFANNWLSAFEYRIAIGIDAFLLSGLSTLAIALLTITYQCLKVANANPAKTLSSE